MHGGLIEQSSGQIMHLNALAMQYVQPQRGW